MKYVYIFIGGGLGSSCRYLISSLVMLGAQKHFPFGTLTVNLAGSFFIGFLFFLFQEIVVPLEIQLFMILGFLGGFTTFSTFSLETVNLLKTGSYSILIPNILLNVIGCLVFTGLGMYAAKVLFAYIKT